MSNDEMWYNWKDFRQWAEEEGVSLDHEDDWKPWWNCWCAALRSIDNEAEI